MYLLLYVQIYYRNVHAAIVVFDMTDPETLRSASSWKTELSTYLSDDDANVPVLLVGNKVYIHM